MNELQQRSKLDALFMQAKPCTFNKGELILRPDDNGSSVYFIEKGFVRVYTLTEWGDEKLFAIYKPGELFPLFWLFDHVPLVRFYEALTEVHARKLSKMEFTAILRAHNTLLFELTNKMIAMVDVLTNRIDNLEYTNAYARLISRLIFLTKRFGKAKGSHIIIDVPLRHKDIASSIAMTRETVSREFERLERKGILKYENKLIVITDMDKLKAELSRHYEKRL